MAWSFTYSDLVAARDEAAADAKEFGGNTAYQRLGRAHLWLDEEAQARESFRIAADSMQNQVNDPARAEDSGMWAKYGHLLRRAGDAEGARAAYERALATASGDRAAELRYLLGRPPDGSGKYGRLLDAIASGDPGARDAIVRELRSMRALPDYTAMDLTLYDLLEATFPAGTSHLEMLRQAGLLVDDAPTAPAVEPPPVGRWTVRDAVLENDGEGPVVARLGSGACVEFIEAFGQWEVRVYRDDVERAITGMHDTFGMAVEAAIDALRADDDEYAVACLTDLLKQYGQPH